MSVFWGDVALRWGLMEDGGMDELSPALASCSNVYVQPLK